MNDNNLRFDLLATPQIIFGQGRFETIKEHLLNYGSKVLIVGNNKALEQSKVRNIFSNLTHKFGFKFETIIIHGEPDTEQIDAGVQIGSQHNATSVIGIGGGSAIDAGKAIAGLLTNGGKAKDYLEVIGNGMSITKPPIPFIAVPTTAGTGSEVTKNAVILSKEDKLKASIRSSLLVPKIAIIDPELMISLPKEVTAYTGLDALTQLIEAYTSNKSQPITNALARIGILRASKSLIFAYENGNDIEAREDMAMAALLSGICLSNAGLGAVHGLAGPIGGLLNIPHGLICGALLLPVINGNISSMLRQVPYPETLLKYAQLGELFGGLEFEPLKEQVIHLIKQLGYLIKSLHITKLSDYGLKEDDFDEIIRRAQISSSMKYNPIELTDEELYSILNKTI
ncbi:MAG: iron-containing alcohol dehydrogenase [Candidatus Heimdallarchaeota archaeon]|nr:iron-containing alcohol dehydrogenase [Candidatus Heimdallarchaeota archaeon]